MANNSGSHRTGSSPSSRYNSGNSQRPASYSERYNRPNPYSGYLPPGAAPSEQIYHPESVDPVRIRQLEREQEQARLHAYEEKAHIPPSGDAVRTQSSNVQRQQRTQTTRAQSTRSAQEAARRGKQTRRSQLAQQQAARASSAYRPPVQTAVNPHLDEIRQNALDEAERLRTRPIEIPTVIPASEPSVQSAPAPVPATEDTEVKTPSAPLPVAGAAQFAAFNVSAASEENNEQDSDVTAPVIIATESNDAEKPSSPAPIYIPVVSSVAEVITPDSSVSSPEPEAENEPEAEAVPAVIVPHEKNIDNAVTETEAASEDTPEEAETEEAEFSEEQADASEIISEDETEDDESPAEKTEVVTVPAEPEISDAPEIPDEISSEPESSDESPEEPQSEDEPEDAAPAADEPDETSEQESPDISEVEDDDVIIVEDSAADEAAEEIDNEDDVEEDDDDVKVYVSPEKNAEETEEDDDFDEDYYEYEDEDEDGGVVTTLPSPIISAPTRRRNFETRISSDLADPSAYSPGVAQDETLFIRKKRPEEATAVFSASTPGLVPDFDDDDFFEQWLEEGDDMIIKDKRQRRRVSAIIGGATMFFAIIGFIFVVVWFINGIPSGSNTSGAQTDYASFILPVVNADPEPFETISSVDNNVLVEAAINRLTYGEAAADHSYTALEVENETRLLIPSADVEKSGKVLFGDDFTIDFSNMYAIEDEKIYYYSAADDCFHVITTSGDIEPSIIKISHIGSRTQVLLEVGYISATEENMEDSDYYKMMEYVLNAVDGGYYISAIRAIEE